jgi:hypothetical protein
LFGEWCTLKLYSETVEREREKPNETEASIVYLAKIRTPETGKRYRHRRRWRGEETLSSIYDWSDLALWAGCDE